VRGIEIIYEDEAIVVVNKPSGMASVADGNRPDEPPLNEVLEASHGRVWTVHRLDRETSGVIVLARNEDAHRILNDQFEQREVSKTYHAIAVGKPDWTERLVNVPLRVNADRQHRTITDRDGGKPASTQFNVLQRLAKFTLISAQPLTGRTHQIRVHAQFSGIPLACDALYGNGLPINLSEFKRSYRVGAHEERPLIERMALHALKLEITHPVTQERMTFEAPYPKDFRATIAQLGKL